MRSQPRVLIAVSLLAAIVPWDLERLDATGPLQASYGVAARHSAVRWMCDDDNGGLTLPGGFCAVVVYDAKTATGAPARIRHIAVAPNGDVFVANQSPPGGVLALRDTDGDGKADQTAQFGTSPGNGIYFKNPYLYFAPDDRIERYQMSPASLTPVSGPEVIVSGLPADGSHRTKTIVVTDSGTLFVGVGSSTDSCQAVPGTVGGLGIDPCPDMPIRAGIWRYDGNLRQVHSATNRFATELRNLVAIALNPYDGELYGIQHGRGNLNRLFPSLFTPRDDAELPAEEFFHFREGGHYGWPYCYYDGRQQKKLLAPEYDGDGHTVSRCADAEDPLLAFPAHYAPNGLHFYGGTQFPRKYRGAAFVAFHGGTNLPESYVVAVVRFAHGRPSHRPKVFADGFIGEGAVNLPADADHRPMGLAEGPDGSLYITDDAGGRIWRVMYAKPRLVNLGRRQSH